MECIHNDTDERVEVWWSNMEYRDWVFDQQFLEPDSTTRPRMTITGTTGRVCVKYKRPQLYTDWDPDVYKQPCKKSIAGLPGAAKKTIQVSEIIGSGSLPEHNPPAKKWRTSNL